MVVDLIGGYKASRWSAQLSVDNLFDGYYIQGSTYQTFYYGNTLGQPRNARFRISWNFGGAR